MRYEILAGMLLFTFSGIMFSSIGWFILAGISYGFALLGFGGLWK